MSFSQLFLGATMALGAAAAQLRQVTNFGENPTNIQMYEYVPDQLAEKPAIIVNVSDHCQYSLFHMDITKNTMYIRRPWQMC